MCDECKRFWCYPGKSLFLEQTNCNTWTSTSYAILIILQVCPVNEFLTKLHYRRILKVLKFNNQVISVSLKHMKVKFLNSNIVSQNMRRVVRILHNVPHAHVSNQKGTYTSTIRKFVNIITCALKDLYLSPNYEIEMFKVRFWVQ